MGFEGVDSSQLGLDLPPLLRGGRAAGESEIVAKPNLPDKPAAAAPSQPTSLLLDRPVRSGQSIYFPDGDVSVLGSVASGAEVVAGGSIHIYGTLRGRAMAGATGNPGARIFCQKIEAELLAIDGYYRTAEEIDAALGGRAMQAWLDGTTLKAQIGKEWARDLVAGTVGFAGLSWLIVLAELGLAAAWLLRRGTLIALAAGASFHVFIELTGFRIGQFSYVMLALYLLMLPTAMVKVPSLVGVGGRAPYMHDGCAATLRDRFGACGGGDNHGHTSQLSDAELADLIAYLDSL